MARRIDGWTVAGVLPLTARPQFDAVAGVFCAIVPPASSASIAASTRSRSLSSGRNSPAQMFQLKPGSLSNAGRPPNRTRIECREAGRSCNRGKDLR